MKIKCTDQTSANNSTRYLYFLKTRQFRNYLCMNLWKSTQNYLTRPWVEYLYFGQLWWLLIKLSLVNSSYSCFWPFIDQSRIITQLLCHVRFIFSNKTNKNSINNSKMAECYSIFPSRSSYSGLIHQIYDSTSTRLRTQPYAILLIKKCWVRTLIRRNLVQIER